MKRRVYCFLFLFLVLALSACATILAKLSPTPSPTATIQTCGLSDLNREVASPDIIDSWSPPAEAASIAPLSCDEIGDVFAYDPQAPLDIQETGQRREESVTIIDLTYASPMGGQVPATLVVPDGAGPFAGMLLQHGMPSTRQSMIPAAVIYARMGAVVLLIDAPFARRADGLNRPRTLTEQDRREQIQLIVDLRRGVDLLLSRPEVDPQRLAFVGISYGASMGGLLAGVEHRLTAYVFQVGNGGLLSSSIDPERRSVWLSIPQEVRQQWVAWMWPIEPIHYVGCASPAALLFQNGTLDKNVLPADALRYQKAGSEPKTIRWYQAGHGLETAAFQDQAEWLSERIGISVQQLAVPVDPQVLAAYAGTYQVNGGVNVTVRSEGACIFLQISNLGEYELIAISEDRFYIWGATDFTFFRNANGKVDRVVYMLSGETHEAKKVP